MARNQPLLECHIFRNHPIHTPITSKSFETFEQTQPHHENTQLAKRLFPLLLPVQVLVKCSKSWNFVVYVVWKHAKYLHHLIQTSCFGQVNALIIFVCTMVVPCTSKIHYQLPFVSISVSSGDPMPIIWGKGAHHIMPSAEQFKVSMSKQCQQCCLIMRKQALDVVCVYNHDDSLWKKLFIELTKPGRKWCWCIVDVWCFMFQFGVRVNC